jgi:hypothetical protein
VTQAVPGGNLAEEIRQEVLAIRSRDHIDLSNKDTIREAQQPLWNSMRSKEQSFVESQGLRLINYFAEGREVIPDKITPRIYPAYDGELALLFRLATMCWGVPATQGMGRRLPLVIMDEGNHKLIGLLNLCDGPYNLDARDKWIGWDTHAKRRYIHLISHSSIIGAVPPYSKMIGGKLIASLLVSQEVRKLYASRYNTEIVLIGNTSALGRSSIYNRLSLFGSLLFIPVGYTKGYGRVLVSPDLLTKMRRFVGKTEKMPHTHHIIQAVCKKLGMPSIAKHGIAREVYVIPLASNSRAVLSRNDIPEFLSYTEAEVAQAALARWVIPRSQRDNSYKEWTLEDTWGLISGKSDISERQLVLI